MFNFHSIPLHHINAAPTTPANMKNKMMPKITVADMFTTESNEDLIALFFMML